MRYEFIIALRYLISNRSVREPTVIGLLTVAGLALSTGMMIIVLSVFAGFEGDLRDKILGTHAHILVSGPDGDILTDPEPLLGLLEQQTNVTGVSPFVESELMISSATNYSGLIVRGLEIGRPMPASDFEQYLIEGSLDWLEDSEQALHARQFDGWDASNPTLEEIDDLQRQIDATRREIEHLRRQAAQGLDIHGEPLPSDAMDENARAEQSDRIVLDGLDRVGEPKRNQLVDPSAENAPANEGLMPGLPAPRAANTTADDPSDLGMPSLPPPRRTDLSAQNAHAVGWDDPLEEDASLMPSLPPPRPGAMPSLPTPSGDLADMPPLPSYGDGEKAEVGAPRIPGIVIGVELQRLLNVLVGDTVNLITPDGDLGPTGLVPRSRPYRVVGVFYTGFYLYDSGMGVMHIDDVRSLLNVPPNEVTGIEVRTTDLHNAYKVASTIEAALLQAGVRDVEVRDWRMLNRSLFVALKLERMAMAAVLIFFIGISGLLVLLVVLMFVIEKRREIAILKAIGASRGNIMRIFLAQGVSMGIVGASLGLLLALGFVAVAVYVGIPLDPNQYYIDRLPIEVNPWEFVLVTLSGLVVTVLATLIPALQAAGLDPVAGLRDDQDN